MTEKNADTMVIVKTVNTINVVIVRNLVAICVSTRDCGEEKSMAECMTFPDTVEEYMEQYKIVDTEQIYTNGTEMVPIFRMKQWFEHKPERKTGKWIIEPYDAQNDIFIHRCGTCMRVAMLGGHTTKFKFCPLCGSAMEGEQP